MNRIAISKVKENGQVDLTMCRLGRKIRFIIHDYWSVDVTLSEAKVFRRELSKYIKQLEALDVKE